MNLKDAVKKLWKSWTIWFGTTLTILPDVLPFVLERLPEAKPYMSQALYDPVMRILGAVVLALRLKTFIQMQIALKAKQEGT